MTLSEVSKHSPFAKATYEAHVREKTDTIFLSIFITTVGTLLATVGAMCFFGYGSLDVGYILSGLGGTVLLIDVAMVVLAVRAASQVKKDRTETLSNESVQKFLEQDNKDLGTRLDWAKKEKQKCDRQFRVLQQTKETLDTYAQGFHVTLPQLSFE